MSTSVFFDPLFLQHVAGETHPESPERLRKIMEVLENSPLPDVDYRKARDATEAELASVHSEKLLSQLKSLAGNWIPIRRCLPEATQLRCAPPDRRSRLWKK